MYRTSLYATGLYFYCSRGLCFSLLLLLLCCYITPATAVDNDFVRVSVLQKYKPQALTILHLDDSDINIQVDKDTLFPLYISPSDKYQISIPGSALKRVYAGSLIIDMKDGRIQIINVVALEDYVKSVVLSEMGLKSIEAMKAQAVLARTWAVRNGRPDKAYDFNDLTDSQVYKGVFDEVNFDDQLSSTHGQVLTYQNKPIKVYYFAECADRSYSVYEIWGEKRYPYYKKINYPVEMRSRNLKNWQRRIEIEKLDQVFISGDSKATSKHPSASSSAQYKISQKQGQLGVNVNEQWYGIDHFRIKVNRALGWNQLRSNHFTSQHAGDYIVFKGNGFGHLVGLCQKSAVDLARKGWRYTEILDLFYPSTKIVSYTSIKKM